MQDVEAALHALFGLVRVNAGKARHCDGLVVDLGLYFIVQEPSG
jgi:hypothetical protein